MKILWFSNKAILTRDIKGSGTWIISMGQSLIGIEGVELVNITEDNVKTIQVTRENNIKEYLLPTYKRSITGIPNRRNVKVICEIVENEAPDIIHIWGVEKYWGLLVSRGYLKGYKCLLEMQGVLSACHQFYRGNLVFQDFKRVMSTPLAILSFSHVLWHQRTMYRRARLEDEIISAFSNVSVQSAWTANWVRSINSNVIIHNTVISLRNEYTGSRKWECKSGQNNIVSISPGIAYKRIDIVLRAFSIIKEKHPDLKLILVGYLPNRKDGYSRFLSALIRSLRLENAISLVGFLTSQEIISILDRSVCTVVSSSVESYSMALAESLAYGIPCVSSYSGAMPEFGRKCNNVEYFSSGDYVDCARAVNSIINDRANNKVYERLSSSSLEEVIKVQLGIYDEVLNSKFLSN